ncbi:MAG: hypothetical protein HW395_1052 [candidate division NC10 bacterium]|jgi:hypothetical protein|nr:hypothetical protein [candidate division NC10 bacterium]
MTNGRFWSRDRRCDPNDRVGCTTLNDRPLDQPVGSPENRPEHRSWSASPPYTRRPLDPAGAMENANDAFPTAPWTAHTPRRPQAPQARQRPPPPTKNLDKNQVHQAS